MVFNNYNQCLVIRFIYRRNLYIWYTIDDDAVGSGEKSFYFAKEEAYRTIEFIQQNFENTFHPFFC